MYLSRWVNEYRMLTQDQLSDDYVVQLSVAVSLLEQHAGRPLTLNDLSDRLINEWVDAMSATKAPDTVRSRRGSILALWREAYQNELVRHPPRRIRRFRSRRQLPQAWTRDEVTALFRASLEQMPGVFRNMPLLRSIYFASLISYAWDTALRLGDCLALEKSDVRPDGKWIVRQHKTGDEVMVQVSSRTLDLINECFADMPARTLIWPLWGRRDAFYRQFRHLVNKAGIRPGTFKWLRRGSVTAVVAAGGDGSMHAGHRGRQVTEQHYIDRSQLHSQRVLPPPLG